ncbi:MAG: hypothetical protein V4751_08115 [Pseudomonadota bacterium]
MVCKPEVVFTALWLLIAPVCQGAVPEVDDETAATEMPALDLLEFLGQWETDDGEWIAPADLENPELVELLESVVQAEATNDVVEDGDGSVDDGGSDDNN